MQTCGLLATFLGIPPELAIAAGTGNSARAYRLDTGVLRPGAAADILLIDAPRGSGGADGLESLTRGDSPSVSLWMIDGEIISVGTRNTLPPKRLPIVRHRDP